MLHNIKENWEIQKKRKKDSFKGREREKREGDIKGEREKEEDIDR